MRSRPGVRPCSASSPSRNSRTFSACRVPWRCVRAGHDLVRLVEQVLARGAADVDGADEDRPRSSAVRAREAAFAAVPATPWWGTRSWRGARPSPDGGAARPRGRARLRARTSSNSLRPLLRLGEHHLGAREGVDLGVALHLDRARRAGPGAGPGRSTSRRRTSCWACSCRETARRSCGPACGGGRRGPCRRACGPRRRRGGSCSRARRAA